MNVAVRPDNLNIISVCTGGGGLDLGIELAMPDARPVVLVEREAFAIGHLVSAMQEGLMAPAPIWSDVTTFDGRPWRGGVDGFVGGIPCQPHSLAGRREGSDDERDLWSDARRIIVQARPWFVLIENVRGMLSAKPGLDPGALRVWRDLRRLGFSVEAGLFTASEVGAPHERERIFILAVADSDRQHDDGTRIIGAGRRGQFADGGSQLADADRERLEGIGTDAGAKRRPDAGRSAGLCDGTALVHAERPERRPNAERGHQPDWHHGGRDQASGRSGEPSALVVNTPIVGRRERRAEPELRSGRDSVAFAGGLFPPGPGDLLRWRHTLEGAPELEPAFRRVADGLASRLDTARVDRLRMLGNGVVSLQAAYAIRTLVTRLAEGGAPGAPRLVRQLWDGVMSAQPDSFTEPASPPNQEGA